MNHAEFIHEVQYRAGLTSVELAEKATSAALETLAERISGDETDHLSAQLPPELVKPLQEGKQDPKSGEVFSLDEFVQRVSNREQVTLPEAMSHARLVLEVIAKAVTPGQWSDVKDNLPDEFESLWNPVS